MTCEEVTRLHNERHTFGREHDCQELGGPGEAAEAYVLGRLSVKCLEEYEEHLLVCGVCREEVEKVTDFIETIRLASEGIDPLPLQAALAKEP